MGKNSGKWAAGALALGAIGYVAGVLTAPKSGRETRADLKHAAVKAKTDAEKKLKAVLRELNAKLEDTKVHGSKLKGKTKEEYEKIAANAVHAKNKVREVLSSLHDGQADDPELKKALSDAKSALRSLERFIKK
jgi:gas vesicle protein